MVQAKPYCLILLAAALAIASRAEALSLASVEEALRTQPGLDTFEVRMATQVQAGQFSVATRSHVICKGPEKLWMEQESPAGRQRTVRNGSKAQTVDLQTGVKQSLDLKDLGSLPATSSPALPLLQSGQYAAPVSIGNSQYRIDLVPGTDATVLSRSFIYDAGSRCISRITQVGRAQDTATTDLAFITVEGRAALSKMDMTIKVQDRVSRISIAYSGYTIPESITDAIFAIKE